MREPDPPVPAPLGLGRARRAIVVVDVVESVRLMRQHEDDVIERWRRFVNDVRTELLPVHRGRLVKSLGDGMLLAFDDAPTALAGALAIQRRIEPYNDGRAAQARIALRIGAHVADVVVDDLDVYGSGVNLAARLATLGAPGHITVSPELREECLDGIDADFDDLGEVYVKHMDEPVHAIRARAPGAPAVTAALALWPADDLSAAVPTIAVLPFDSPGALLSLGEVVADGIVNQLAASHVLRVISHRSASALARRNLTGSEIGAQLGCQYLLGGRCIDTGGGVLMSVELIAARDGEVLWADRLTTSVGELLQRDDPVTRELARQTAGAVLEHELRLVSNAPLPTLADCSLQLGAVALMHRSPRREFDHAADVLGQLVERHPRAAQPRALFAQWHVLRVTRGLATDPAEEARRALDHTRRAIDSDADNALALAAEGFVHCHVLKDLDAAQDRLDRALALKPNEPLAWLFQCVVHGFRGDGEAAWRSAQRAITLSPLDPMRVYFDALASSAALAAGLLDPAVTLADRALRTNRNHLPTLRALTIALVERGELPRARQTAARVLALEPRFTVSDYLARAPRGSGPALRERYAAALRAAGLPP